MTYFTLDETPFARDCYILRIDFDHLPLYNTKGSYQLLFARLMGLSWPDYVRMCRDLLNAEVHGKGSMYPTIYYKKNEATRLFLRVLNKRAELAMKHRAQPNLEEIVAELKKEKKNFGERKESMD